MRQSKHNQWRSWTMRSALAAMGVVLAFGSVYLAKLYTATPSVPEYAAYLDASRLVDDRVEDLLGRMTLTEKIGQMTLVEKNSLKDPADVAFYGIGAVLSGAGGNPEDNTPRGWKEMVDGFGAQARATRLGIPLLYGVDASHGFGNVPGATLFPHAIGLGAANDPELVERIARATAEESSAMGVRWNYSPMLELPRDIRWGRVYEAFSDDPARTGVLGAAYVHGLQDGPDSGRQIDVLATAKHYLGLGSMVWGTAGNKDYRIDQGTVPNDEAALRENYLPPFREAVDAGAMSVMAGIGTWDGAQIVASKYLLTDVLKGELDFRGFVVSDWYGLYNISWSRYESTATGINAGVDMAMLPFDYKWFANDVLDAVAGGAIPQARIDDAVRRILRVKFALGLFDEQGTTEPGLDTVGSSAHRALAREAVRRSLVLLKNHANTLPISADARLLRVAGSAADNVGRQAGGWTVEWQGIDGNWLPGATSILAGIRQAAGSATSVEYDLNGSFKGEDIADVGIAVVGEKPYSEGVGDNERPQLDDADIAAIANLRKTSKTVVVILVTGRPLLISDELPTWDAAVAAWLPGSEGEGVADALFGTSPFTATLPLPWPRTIEQVPILPNGQTHDGTDPLFPRGFGLR